MVIKVSLFAKKGLKRCKRRGFGRRGELTFDAVAALLEIGSLWPHLRLRTLDGAELVDSRVGLCRLRRCFHRWVWA